MSGLGFFLPHAEHTPLSKRLHPWVYELLFRVVWEHFDARILWCDVTLGGDHPDDELLRSLAKPVTDFTPSPGTFTFKGTRAYWNCEATVTLTNPLIFNVEPEDHEPNEHDPVQQILLISNEGGSDAAVRMCTIIYYHILAERALVYTTMGHFTPEHLRDPSKPPYLQD